MKYNFLLLCLSILLLSCQRDDRIKGIWVRQGDLFAGIKVEVKKTGEIVNGTIVSCPDSLLSYGITLNDVKWKGIKKLEGNNYEFEDLGKSVDYNGNIISTRYSLARLLIENDTIKIRLYVKGDEQIGTEQIWIRAK